MTLPPEWSEFIALLCAARVRFLIVGAHALAVHGRPRATGDLDILVEPSSSATSEPPDVLDLLDLALLPPKPKASIGSAPQRPAQQRSQTSGDFGTDCADAGVVAQQPVVDLQLHVTNPKRVPCTRRIDQPRAPSTAFADDEAGRGEGVGEVPASGTWSS